MPLLARWTTDWDSGYETDWWYVIKDTPFDVSVLKAKRRYEITKGNKNFAVQLINPIVQSDAMYRVTIAAYSGWPKKYRPIVTRDQMAERVRSWEKALVFGAFARDDRTLQGYAIVEDNQQYAAFSVLRTNPEAEKQGINAAIVDAILAAFADRFHDGFYICDGARSIRHETAFQDYLEKYFSFRKAYTKLNIKYRCGLGFVVNALYPFRELIKGNFKIGSQVSGIMKMEEIIRNNQM